MRAQAIINLIQDFGFSFGRIVHLTPLTAKAFGFDQPIIHGMWTMARCAAAMDLPERCTLDISFMAPILLPSNIIFAHRDHEIKLASVNEQIQYAQGGVRRMEE